MKIKKLSYNEIPFLSPKDLAYINLDSRLDPFYTHSPQLSSVLPAIQLKKEQAINRPLLVEVIKSQYEGINTSSAVINNIDQLAHSNTFTVITAHQPCLFTGPLYFIYKIASAIHLSEKLNEQLEDYRIIPLFIMGGEDHDFDEMNHIRIDHQKLTWNKTETGGPVGRMDNEGLKEIIAEIQSLLPPSNYTKDIIDHLHKFFCAEHNYGQAMIRFVDYIFQDYGLVILNMDSARLKKEFIEIMKDDIHYHSSFKLVGKSQQELLEKGIESQAFVREINLFYVHDNLRSRIELFEGKYLVGDEQISEVELFRRLEESPENFSPNVILRPLYQEKIIPNIAYIGGGGEIAYWLERKHQFEHYHIPFPILIRRNSALYLDKKHQKLLKKSQLGLHELFVDDLEYFISSWIKEHFDASLYHYKTDILDTLERIRSKAAKMDTTLGPYVGARSKDVEKIIDQIEKKLVKASKSQSEIEMNRIRKLYQYIFPDQSLQERKSNFLGIYAEWGPEFIQSLVQNMDPFDRNFLLIEE